MTSLPCFAVEPSDVASKNDIQIDPIIIAIERFVAVDSSEGSQAGWRLLPWPVVAVRWPPCKVFVKRRA